MSGYRDELEAARHRIETLEAKIAERDASLNARDAELSELRAEVSRTRRNGVPKEAGDAPPKDKTILLGIVLAVSFLALVGGVLAVWRVDQSMQEEANPPPVLAPSPLPAPVVPVETAEQKPSEVDLIQKVVMSAKPQTRQCYQDELKRDPAASGFTSVMLEILPDGKVREVTLDRHATISGEKFNACLLRVYKGLQFPKLSSTVKTKVPLTFIADPADDRLGL